MLTQPGFFKGICRCSLRRERFSAVSLLNGIKRLPTFCCGGTQEIRHQPFPVAGLFRRLCHWKWLIFSFLKYQRDTQYKASAIEPANGKTREKAVFFQHIKALKRQYPMAGPFRKAPSPGASIF